jgi:ABC-type nitrate/sulfonate/bicarbonate transport system substrate-binding protein
MLKLIQVSHHVFQPLKIISAHMAVALLAAAGASCSAAGYTGVETIRLGTLALETSTLIFVADNQNYFSQNGLDIEFHYYDTGLLAINALLSGDVDIASPVGEYAFVGKIFDKHPVKTIGALDKTDYQKLAARKDRGIANPSDLKGKKVGVIRNTQQEYYLIQFLEINGLGLSDVELVGVTAAESVDAIVSGRVDAVMMVPPYTTEAMEKLGDKLKIWPAQSLQLTQQLIICQAGWLAENPDLAERFLDSLEKAQSYLSRFPGQAKQIVKERLSLGDDDTARIWSENEFGLSLEQTLIIAMENEARWIIKNNLTTEKQTPNFLDYIFEDALKAVKPEAVNIIR